MQLRLHWRNEAPLPSEGLWASRSLHSDRKLARLQWEICHCSQATLPWLWPSSKYGQLSGCWPCQQQIPSETEGITSDRGGKTYHHQCSEEVCPTPSVLTLWGEWYGTIVGYACLSASFLLIVDRKIISSSLFHLGWLMQAVACERSCELSTNN